MTFAALADRLPDHARDLRLNLTSLAAEEVLSVQQRYGTFLATALASGNADVIAAAEAEAALQLTPEAVTAARAAASIMAMNNIYYRFVHLSSNKDYGQMPARLRMNILGRPGIEKADFELFALAVSAINGCGMCIDAHEKVLREHGVGAEAIQASVKIAAVVFAVGRTLTAQQHSDLSLAA